MASLLYNSRDAAFAGDIRVLPYRSHLTRVGAALLLALPILGQRIPKDFHFSPADEKLLQDATELDSQFEKKGLLYGDPTAQEYLDHIGQNLLGGSPRRVLVV